MEENKELLTIYREGLGVRASWNALELEDMMSVVVSIADLARRNEPFLILLLGTIKEALSNEEFQQMLDADVVEMPDFDSLLKNLNNG